MVLASGFIAFRQLYDRTIYVWENGSERLSFDFPHVPIITYMVYVLLLLLHVWLLIAITITLWHRRKPGGMHAILVCCGLLVLAAIWAPGGRCLYVLFQVWGPGPSGAANLVSAAGRGELYNVRTLMNYGVPVDATDRARNTALTNASWEGHLDIVKYLVGAGAKIDRQTGIRSSTALMDAVQMNHPDVVEYLLQAGADRTLVDSSGRTAMDWARKGSDKRVLAAFAAEQRR